jgi:ABC-2 type transport system ATP-binding protein
MKELIINNITKSYGSVTVLENVSAKYVSGKIHGLIGDNGSGKTTLLNCISKDADYDGEIKFSNIDTLGYLSVDPYVFPRTTGYEFLHYCLCAKKVHFDNATIDKLNQLFQLPLKQYAENYSTGMLKKLHLMNLVLQKNALLLLDEPFNGLDIHSASYFTEILKQLKRQDIIILVSSHALYHMIGFCDTISYIHDKSISFLSEKSEFNALVNRLEEETKSLINQFINITA